MIDLRFILITASLGLVVSLFTSAILGINQSAKLIGGAVGAGVMWSITENSGNLLFWPAIIGAVSALAGHALGLFLVFSATRHRV